MSLSLNFSIFVNSKVFMAWEEVWSFSFFERLAQLALRATWNQHDSNVRTQTFSDRRCLRENSTTLVHSFTVQYVFYWDHLRSDLRWDLSRKPKKPSYQLWNPTEFSPYIPWNHIGYSKKRVVLRKLWECGCACVLFASKNPPWTALLFKNDADLWDV